MTLIDRSDPNVTGSVVKTDMFKVIIPDPLMTTSYTVEFPVQLYESNTTEYVVYSSIFTYQGRNVRLLDEPTADNTFIRNLFMVDTDTSERLYKYGVIGTVDTANAKVTITDIQFDTSNAVAIFARPNTYDIVPRYKQLLLIDEGLLEVVGEIDTVSTYNVKGLATYSPFSRH